MANRPLRIPWQYLDALEPVRSSEFGTPTGYVDPDDYRAKAASQALPHADRED